ncbi:MAG TPA: hypothetical protein VM934_05640 [Pyrinomonadaceae bacterium]|jgi:hypothetical protein|nr:hypothetical protein [Pyrinomonadaceae bacterium]
MGFEKIQEGLASLLTDARLRERFFVDPLKVGQEMGLSREESRQLSQLSAPHADHAAASTDSKRLVAVGKLLPLTQRMLQHRFNTFFREYAETHVSLGVQEHLGDALAFAAYIEARARTERLEPRWALDLLRYEKARLRAADPARRFVVCYFRHDISKLVRSAARREETLAVFARPAVAVWWRPRRRGTVRYAVLVTPNLFRRP